uniref:hypothetical protein n=1 Tax=Vibrio alfacsensis TaxID=1074311 RepID=UPI0013E3B482|nr:hypothetical protein [Vibrio alfacsensis]
MSESHFQGKYEVELKYAIESKTNFLATLKSIPYEIMLENNIESDRFFDTPTKT